jgi:ATP-dependent DNA helicase RecQ
VPQDPVSLLRRHLGYPGFRPGQEELVRAVLAGRDALGVLPTGGGKSVCYQVPALALEGLSLVVTPLVSLMQDQVGRARAIGLRAAHLSATQSAEERSRALAAATAGELDLLFVSPERLDLLAFREFLKGVDVRFLAVDEAHCISEWGHDFRPAYRRIGMLRGFLSCPVLALTATATPAVRTDVMRSLSLSDPLVVVKSFDRPNLSWSVLPGGAPRERAGRVYRVLRRQGGCSIVYAPTRRSVEAVRDSLAGWGLRTEAYHAGLPGEERSRVQAAFMNDECRVVVATNAFGMGIDKADVRLVAHVQLPGTLEAYYQEAGRAGRDGAPSSCVAFHAPSDARLPLRFIDRTHPPVRLLRRVHRRLRRKRDGAGVVSFVDPELCRALGVGAGGWPEVGPLAALERLGALRRLEDAGTDGEGAGSLCHRAGVRDRVDLSVAARLRRLARGKVAAVLRYAGSRGCRRRALLGYFGERAPGGCGSCDRCTAARA